MPDVAGIGGREQQVLTLLWQQGENPANVADKAHVQHAVRLVQHQDLDGGKIDVALRNVVQQPARCRDQNIHAASQLLDLRVDLDAAEDDRGVQRQVPAVGVDALPDLRRQLAGRRQDQRTHRAPALARQRIGVQALQQRQGETGGLAGAGLGTGENVAPLQNDRDGLALYRRGFAVALIGDSTKKFGRQAERIE